MASTALPSRHLSDAAHLARQGNVGGALQLLSPLLANGPAQVRITAARAFAGLVATVTPPAYHPQFEHDLLACFAAPIDHQPLARPTAALLLMKPGEPPGDPLWTAFLTRCINVDPAMEARLIALRAAVDADTPTGFVAALAIQAFANGYVLPGRPADGVPALHAALYRPPTESDRPVLAAIGGPLVDLLIRRTLDDPAAERAIAAALPSLGEPTDAVSVAVRAQYEAAPYPRWQAPPAPDPRSLGTLVGSPVREVLVAGSGTGYEAIDLARTDPAAHVTALDLSRASLAYGQRMANALGLRITFLQGDLLRLERWANRFDLVTSTGVLHHLGDPLAGLRSLARVVRPGGTIRIALYSARARAPIAAAHALIRERGWTADADGIRAFRAHVLAAPPGDPLRALTTSDDFFAMSGCRDLCFHVREHWFSLPQAGALVAAAGLMLVGLDAPPEARAAFGAGDPLDLERWDRVEARHPALFAGMYHLWCRRPARRGRSVSSS